MGSWIGGNALPDVMCTSAVDFEVIIAIVGALQNSEFMMRAFGFPEHHCAAYRVIVRRITLSGVIRDLEGSVLKRIVGELISETLKVIRHAVTVGIILEEIRDAIAIVVIGHVWVSSKRKLISVTETIPVSVLGEQLQG